MIITVNEPTVLKNVMSFSWGNKRWVTVYPEYVDLELVPRDLLWIMFGMVTSEEWAWGPMKTIELPEMVDEKILAWWKGLMRINWKANPYGLNKDEWFSVDIDREPIASQIDPVVRGTCTPYPTMMMNGLGKDALCQLGMLLELNGGLLSVTVDHEWAFPDKEVYKGFLGRLALLSTVGVPTTFVKTNANEVFDLHIMPWYIYALPLMWLHQTRTCYHAMEIEFNKYQNGVPVKPNTSVPVLLSINKLLKSLGYDMEYRSGTVPLSSFGTQKLLVERYPELQKLQTSCMHGFPACNTCPKCQCHMAYLKAMGRNPKKYGYNGKIRKTFDVAKLLDIERESQHWALSEGNAAVSEEGWLPNRFWVDATPYGIPESDRLLEIHLGFHEGAFTSYGYYTYNVSDWEKTAEEICEG